MKKLLLALFLSLNFIGISQDKTIFSIHIVKVDGDLEAFEKVQKNYMQRVAKAAVEKGDIGFWAFLKFNHFDNVDNEERMNYAFIQNNKNIDAFFNEKNAWWNNASNVLSDSEQELVAALSKNFTWTKDGRHIFVEEAGIAKGLGRYIQFNFATPKNLQGFIDENNSLWKNFFNSNMSSMGMVNWGVGRRIAPISNEWSSVVTWDMFNTLEELMNFRVGFKLPSNIVNKSKMTEYNPSGWNSSQVLEVLASSLEE
jgi:hypothetical protein|tara:strand:+ start:769 stop:1533 length:765 start_codon:yes stop_codon:yes gene_type:complete